MTEYNFVKQINSDKLQYEIGAAGLPAPKYIETENTNVKIVYETGLSEAQVIILESCVTNHVWMTTAESLKIFLDEQVMPFVKNLITEFAAENISMGITQAGKTGQVLGLFSKPYNVYSNEFHVSLKNSFDTGSLYVARDVIQYVRNNPTEFDGLSPFVTDARLLSMKNKIEKFLGLPLSS